MGGELLEERTPVQGRPATLFLRERTVQVTKQLSGESPGWLGQGQEPTPSHTALSTR